METHDLKSLIDDAVSLEFKFNMQLSAIKNSDEKLTYVQKELRKVVQDHEYSYFITGKRLSLIKKVCEESNISFKGLFPREDKHKVSYETALNYIRIYYCCLLFPEVTERIGLTILHKVCAPNFNSELRKYLFESGLLEGASGKKFDEIMDKIKIGGIDAVAKEAETVSREKLIVCQVRFTYNTTVTALEVDNKFKKDIATRGVKGNNGMMKFTEQIKADQPEAEKINLILYNANEQAISIKKSALTECSELLTKINPEYAKICELNKQDRFPRL